MSGDADSQSSIMVADDLFGEHGLINDPALWRTRWGMDDVTRTTLDDQYFLKVEGSCQSQSTRTVEMEVDGEYIYWGEDRPALGGLSIYRAHRETLQVEEVGPGDIIGAPWRFLKTSDDRFLFLTSSIHWQGRLMPGSDGFVHLYELNLTRTDYQELARFPERANAPSGGQPFGFVEAFGRLWVNGYNITERQADVVGRLISVRLGDFDEDGLLTVADIDALSAAIRTGDRLPIFDLDLDGQVNELDRWIWVKQLAVTLFGDANLDGTFNSADLVLVFQTGQYEDGGTGNPGWAGGDWNGDGVFSSRDIVTAFVDGGYERGQQPALLGDYNQNGLLDAGDLNLQAIKIVRGDHPSAYDLNGDTLVDWDDRQMWVHQLKNTWIGDANLDLEFDSSDLIQIFAGGKYETNETATWEQGDFTGDTKFDSKDLVAVFVYGPVLNGSERPVAVATVPQPETKTLLTIGLVLAFFATRQRTVCGRVTPSG